MTEFLAIDGISKAFGGLRALDNCSFSLKEGLVSCIVGPNGAGKTTLFDVVTGFLKPNEGAVRFRGETTTGLRPRDIVQRGVARTFQNLRLFPELSVIDNVMVCLADESGNDPLTSLFRPWQSERIVKRKQQQALDILETVGLRHKANDAVRRISFGQQKLLCIARVLATDAPLLLLDEPTSGLAAAALDNVTALIKRLSQSGRTLLVIEHNTQIVRDIADAIVFMHQGRVLATGAPNEVLDRQDLIEIYFGGAV
jgi:branched-chain amino acid transport system ATP-binding protein